MALIGSGLVNPVQQFLDGAGLPYALGSVTWTVVGVSTKQDTYADPALTIPNPNPQILDASGRCKTYFLPLPYDLTLRTDGGAVVYGPVTFTSAGVSGAVATYTHAGLPAASSVDAGRLARQSDGARGLWMDTGAQWFGVAGEIFNVREFGAKGDGIADDTTAIQAALDAANAAGRGRVFVPAGIYKVTSPLKIYSNTTFAGAGYGSQILQGTNPLPDIPAEFIPSTTVSAIVYGVSGASNIIIADLFVNGTWASGDPGITVGILLGLNTANSIVRHCWTDHIWWSGIRALGSGHLILGNRASNSSVDGIEVWGSQVRVIGNYVISNGYGTGLTQAGIEVATGSDVVPTDLSDVQVIGNICDGNALGIQIGGNGNLTNILVADNLVRQCQTRGINADGATTNLTIRGNIIRKTDQGAAGDATGNGLVVTKATGFVVSGNIVDSDNGTGSGPNAINVAVTANNGVITGNVVTGYWGGIIVDGTGASILVHDNVAFSLRSGVGYSLTNANAISWGNVGNAATTNALAITGRFEGAKGASVAAANTLTLGTDGNLFHITGNTQINLLATANWQAGSVVRLIFDGTPTVKHNQAPGAGTAAILLAGAADFVASANDLLQLVYDGTSWFGVPTAI